MCEHCFFLNKILKLAQLSYNTDLSCVLMSLTSGSCVSFSRETQTTSSRVETRSVFSSRKECLTTRVGLCPSFLHVNLYCFAVSDRNLSLSLVSGEFTVPRERSLNKVGHGECFLRSFIWFTVHVSPPPLYLHPSAVGLFVSRNFEDDINSDSDS